jgi:Flp pilus assembly protein TadD
MLQQHPEQYDTHLILAQSLAATGAFDQAVSTPEKAIALRPIDPQPHVQLASIYEKLGRLDDATRERQEGTRLRNSEENRP